jgi:hypothetical protein
MDFLCVSKYANNSAGFPLGGYKSQNRIRIIEIKQSVSVEYMIYIQLSYCCRQRI